MKLLLTGSYPYSEKELKEIRELGFLVYFHQNEAEKINFDVSEIEVVVCVDIFKANDIRRFKSLKYLKLTTVGSDSLPHDYLLENEITVLNAKDTYAVPMGEWAVLKILEILKKSREFLVNQSNKKWLKNVESLELFNKNVLIIGYGNVGKAIKERLSGFKVNFFVYNRSPVLDLDVNQIKLTKEDLKTIDIVIVSLPLTKETYHLLDLNFFNNLKDNVVLINLARGSVIKEKDLITALNNGKFLGLGLDVFETEPLPKESPLWSDERVYLTPHYSYYSEQLRKRQYNNIINDLKIVKKALNLHS